MPVEKKLVLQQLRSVEAYIQVVSQMLEQDQPCQLVLNQLDAVQSAVEAAGSQLLRMEIERCLQAIRDNPCAEQRCEELTRLGSLYPLFSRLTVKFYETSVR